MGMAASVGEQRTAAALCTAQHASCREADCAAAGAGMYDGPPSYRQCQRLCKAHPVRKMVAVAVGGSGGRPPNISAEAGGNRLGGGHRQGRSGVFCYLTNAAQQPTPAVSVPGGRGTRSRSLVLKEGGRGGRPWLVQLGSRPLPWLVQLIALRPPGLLRGQARPVRCEQRRGGPSAGCCCCRCSGELVGTAQNKLQLCHRSTAGRAPATDPQPPARWPLLAPLAGYGRWKPTQKTMSSGNGEAAQERAERPHSMDAARRRVEHRSMPREQPTCPHYGVPLPYLEASLAEPPVRLLIACDTTAPSTQSRTSTAIETHSSQAANATQIAVSLLLPIHSLVVQMRVTATSGVSEERSRSVVTVWCLCKCGRPKCWAAHE